MNEPRRWIDEGAPDPVRALLESTRLDEPTAAQLARVSQKLGRFGAPALSPPAAPTRVAARSRAWLVAKVIGAIAAVAIALGAFHLGRVYQEQVTPPPQTRIVVVPAEVALLEQAREVLAIEALVTLGKRPEARERADAFKQRFPTSTRLREVEALVQ